MANRRYRYSIFRTGDGGGLRARSAFCIHARVPAAVRFVLVRAVACLAPTAGTGPHALFLIVTHQNKPPVHHRVRVRTVFPSPARVIPPLVAFSSTWYPRLLVALVFQLDNCDLGQFATTTLVWSFVNSKLISLEKSHDTFSARFKKSK